MMILGPLLGALGFLSNIVVVAIICVLLGNFFSNFFFNIFTKICKCYEKGRTLLFRILLKHNKITLDLYRRSYLHLDILCMQSYLKYLTDMYGGFEVCPLCHFPHKPDVYNCPYCNYIPAENFNKAVKLLKEG